MDSDESKSISFIELPFEIQINKREAPKLPTSIKIPSDVVDPLFINFFIEIPEKFEKYLKKAASVNFIYNIVKEQYFKVVNRFNQELILSFYCENYQEFDFNASFNSRIFLIFGRFAYITNEKAIENKRYKECIKKGISFEENQTIKTIRDKYLNYQLKYGSNYIFIDNTEDFLREIKFIVTCVTKKREYVPKIKSFNTLDKREFMSEILSSIPGISRIMASAIVEKFKTFEMLKKALEENIEAVSSISILEGNSNIRKIGDKIVNKIHLALSGNDPNEKLI